MDSFSDFEIEDSKKLKAKCLYLRKKIKGSGIESNSKEFLKHFEMAYYKKWNYDCYAGNLFTLINHKGDVFACYHKTKAFNIREMKFEKIVNDKAYDKIINEVKSCKIVCHDNGKMEPSLRMNLRYSIINLKNSWNEFKNL